MTEVTEIYSVRGAEDIRDGALEYSDSIATRPAAETDAAARCRRDPSIRKVVYYRVRSDGSFRTLFAYDNPHARRDAGKRPRRQMTDPLPRGQGRRARTGPRKQSLLDRLLASLKD